MSLFADLQICNPQSEIEFDLTFHTRSKEMRDLLTTFGELTTDARFLYDQINDFILEALRTKAR